LIFESIFGFMSDLHACDSRKNYNYYALM